MSNFYIEAIESTMITLSKEGEPTAGTVKYSIGSDNPTTNYNYGNSINLTTGQKCYFTITSTTSDFGHWDYLYFTSTGKIKVGGNLSSLIGGNTAIPRHYCFHGLFLSCKTLVDASSLNFGSITNFNSKTFVFSSMFEDCTSLTTPPELPATTLANGCYAKMFSGCENLLVAPKLPAITLANSCYSSMFSDCENLLVAPELPATTLAFACYLNMFCRCGLITPPELPATTLADSCYMYMFESCWNIKLSTTQTEVYTTPYRIPSSGTGTTSGNSLEGMFESTGSPEWPSYATPTINTTYYIPSPPVLIVTYDDDIIYTDDDKCNITLPTIDKKMSGDINVIVSVEDGNNIAY